MDRVCKKGKESGCIQVNAINNLKVSAESLRPRKNGSSGFQPRNETRREWMYVYVSPTEHSTIRARYTATSNNTLKSNILLPLSLRLITCLQPQSPSFAPPRSKAKPHLASSPNVRSSATPARPTSRTPAQLVSFRNFAHVQTHNHALTHHHRHLTTRSFDRAALTALHPRAIIAIRLDP